MVATSLITFPPDPTQLYVLTPTFYLTSIAHCRVTLEGWVTIEFLTHIGQTCTPLHQEFILLSNVLGVPVLALVNALNNPPVSTGMESSILEPFFKVRLIPFPR